MRWDGGNWWFEEIDRRADPLLAEQLRKALVKLTPLKQLAWPGLTPETRATYGLAREQVKESREKIQHNRDEARLRNALRVGGGALSQFRDRGEHWLVEWRARDGARHHSAISKKDFTVISSGICLSGRDNDFDLQSLVGVMAGKD